MKIAVVCSLLGLMCGPSQPQSAESIFDCRTNQPEIGMGRSDGSFQYKTVEVSPGKCKWVINEDAMKASADRETHRQNLVTAMRSRLLTADEMQEVTQLGLVLVTPTGIPYIEADKQRELNDLYFQQFRFRAEAERSK